MKVTVDPAGTAVVEFESLEELRAEYEANLAAGGVCLTTEVRAPLFSTVRLTIRLAGAGEVDVVGTVVNHLPGGVAVSFETPPEAILAALTSSREAAAAPERELGIWDRVRGLSRNEKLLLAPKASRNERAVLAQENDAQMLYFLLKNPRITIEEVARIARSPLLSSPTADLIANTTQWSASVDVRVALVNNPKTPSPLALRLLPTLPEPEIRRVAKATAVSQAIKQAALRIVINRA
jgi:hypothetical protein